MSEQMRKGERAQRADGVDEERVRAVERVDVAAVGNRGPAARLHRAAHFQRELVEPAAPTSLASIRPSRASRHRLPYVLTLLKP